MCIAVAGVVELVDARHSKCRSLGSVGSSPTARTIFSLYLRAFPKNAIGFDLAILESSRLFDAVLFRCCVKFNEV